MNDDDSADLIDDEIRIGISACLLGEPVRFDGGHKRDAFLVETLKPFVRFVPVCPEMEIGLGAPRETLRLVRDESGLRLVAPKSGEDLTARMESFARRRAAALRALDLHGFVLKKDSPSCGLERVKVYDRHGVPAKDGQGLFATALLAADPLLAVEEEGRLHDPKLRETFFVRVFAVRRLRRLFEGRFSLGRLVEHHASEKLLLLAHDPVAYRALGRVVANAKRMSREALLAEYVAPFLRAIAAPAPRRRQVNALQHAAGHVKEALDAEGRAELAGLIADYGKGLVPLIVPVTLLRHHARRTGATWLLRQTYLDPHPKELALRNHV